MATPTCNHIRARHPSPVRWPRASGRKRGGFTLVEVVLAIVIALGILLVLLYFYHQATHLRSQAIEQTERIAAARLVMDRMTSDLRAFKPEAEWGRTFTGSSNAIEFVKADVPAFSPWTGGALGRAGYPATDLKIIRYQLEALGQTNAGGLLRSEEPLVRRRGTPVVEEVASTNAAPIPARPPVIEEIQFLHFRFWSGTNWLDTWSYPGGPRAVEISLAAEAFTNETDTAELDVDIFRRVVCLPEAQLAGNRSFTWTLGDPEANPSAETGEP